MDVEGAELESLPEWLESGALDRVEQLAMELHLPPVHQKVVEDSHYIVFMFQADFSSLLGILQKLLRLGFRVISHEINMTVKTQSTAGISTL